MAELFNTVIAIYCIIALVFSISFFGALLGPLVWFLGLLPFVAILQHFIKEGDRFDQF